MRLEIRGKPTKKDSVPRQGFYTLKKKSKLGTRLENSQTNPNQCAEFHYFVHSVVFRDQRNSIARTPTDARSALNDNFLILCPSLT